MHGSGAGHLPEHHQAALHSGETREGSEHPRPCGKGAAQALQWPRVFNFSLSDVVGYFMCLQLSAALQPAVNISVGPAGLLF